MGIIQGHRFDNIKTWKMIIKKVLKKYYNKKALKHGQIVLEVNS